VLLVRWQGGRKPLISMSVCSSTTISMACSAHLRQSEHAPGAVLTVDRLWNALSDNGGQPGPCGWWIKDQFGLLWQIIPRALGRMFSVPDTAAAGRPCRRCSGWAKSTSPNSNAP
jgi:predicted 3-demethylubiquinone-9 3-methyltransferase (glyoxalase superfamily)